MSSNPADIFIYYLNQLQKLLEKIETFSKGDEHILAARLHEDMFPLGTQASIAANFSLRACCPLAGRALVSFKSEETHFTTLKQSITETIRYLETIEPQEFDRSATEILREQAGFAEIALPREKFLQQYIFPNFYFHLSMVYAIARSREIPLSKQDYDGYHQYPEGFSFIKR